MPVKDVDLAPRSAWWIGDGIVRLVISAAEVDDLGVDTPEGDSVGEVSYKGQRYPAEIIALRMAVSPLPAELP